MSRVKLTANNHCHKPVKGGEQVEALITVAAEGNLSDYLSLGRDINVRTVAGMNALHALARKGSGTSRDRKAFEVLMEAGIDVHVRNNREETPLFRAVLTRSEWMWEPLVEAGAGLDVVNGKGLSISDVAPKENVLWANLVAKTNAGILAGATPDARAPRRSYRI